MAKLTLPLFALALAALVPGPVRSTRLHFAPRDGQSLQLQFERVLKLELGRSELTVTYDGEAQEGQEPPGVELEMTETETLTLSDVFKVEAGRVVEIRRRFDEIGNRFIQGITDPAGESFERKNVGHSELEGQTVLFRRGPEGEDFVATFDEESELDVELLEGLEASADLAGFLPAGEVEVGEGWEVGTDAFVRMTNLSGDLHVRQEGQDEQETGDYGRQFDEKLAGRIQAELEELRESDGRRVAIIALHMELSTAVEISKEVEADDVEGREQETHAFEIELDGSLHWDVAGGHALALELSGDVGLSVVAKRSYDFEGHEMVVEERQEFEGTITFEATVE
jgi:hypothetical protein